MIPEGISMGELVQHAIVSLVALGALGVVIRKVRGVFETRPPSQPPGCGTCAAGHAAQKKQAPPSSIS